MSERKPNSVLTGMAFHPFTTAMDFYTRLYGRGETSDSPYNSVSSLVSRAGLTFFRMNSSDRVLDLGSGRQNVEAHLRETWGTPSCQFVSLDIADLNKRKLLATKFTSHVRATGDYLPFANDSFSGAVSNMAFDFMPREAAEELYRVLKPGAKVFLNLHHENLKDKDLAELNSRSRNKLTVSQRQVRDFWNYLKEEKILFQNADEIRDFFSACNFNIGRIEEKTDGPNLWWEVDMTK